MHCIPIKSDGFENLSQITYFFPDYVGLRQLCLLRSIDRPISDSPVNTENTVTTENNPRHRIYRKDIQAT